MSQVDAYTIPAAPLKMAALQARLQALFAAAVSANRGPTAPEAPFEGMLWWDSSADPVDTLKRYTVTAGWRSLLSVNISTGAVTFAGLVIGTDVQGYNAKISALAALSAAADKLAYFTGPGTMALTDLTPFARTLISSGDAVTARANLSVYAKSEVDARQPSFRNLLINGDMRVAQRYAGVASLSNSVSYVALDRWAGFVSAGSGCVMGQVAITGLTGFTKAMALGRSAGSTATGLLMAGQALESIHSLPLAGATLTVSFWAKAGANFSSSSSQLTCFVCSGTGTDQSVSGLPGGWTGETYPVGGACILTNAWQRYSFTGTVPANCTQLGIEFYYNPVGTAGADDNAYITGVQLESWSTATAFEALPYDMQLSRCQRYARAFPKLQSVCTYSNGTTSAYLLPTGALAAMRATPTVLKDVGGTTALSIANGTGAVTFTSLTPNMADNQTFANFVAANVNSALTVGQSYTLSNLLLSAEL